MVEIVKEFNDMISQYIRTITVPVAVRFFKEGEELPPKTRIPTRDFGDRILICQAMGLVRRYGWTVAFHDEDQCCPVAQFMYGFREEPDFVKDGCIVYPLYAGSMEAGARTQAEVPRLPKADTHCVVFAPLDKCDFEPDVVICYGNAAQIVRLIQGSQYNTGGSLECKFAGRTACGAEVIVPYLTDKCNLIVPGGGERVFGMTADDELAFAVPYSQMKNVISGVKAVHKAGVARIPTPVWGLTNRPSMPSVYEKIEAHYGMR